jgi:hypothetical protein
MMLPWGLLMWETGCPEKDQRKRIATNGPGNAIGFKGLESLAYAAELEATDLGGRFNIESLYQKTY